METWNHRDRPCKRVDSRDECGAYFAIQLDTTMSFKFALLGDQDDGAGPIVRATVDIDTPRIKLPENLVQLEAEEEKILLAEKIILNFYDKSNSRTASNITVHDGNTGKELMFSAWNFTNTSTYVTWRFDSTILHDEEARTILTYDIADGLYECPPYHACVNGEKEEKNYPPGINDITRCRQTFTAPWVKADFRGNSDERKQLYKVSHYSYEFTLPLSEKIEANSLHVDAKHFGNGCYTTKSNTNTHETIYVQCEDFYADGFFPIIHWYSISDDPSYVCGTSGCFCDNRSFMAIVLAPIFTLLLLITLVTLLLKRRNKIARDDLSLDPDHGLDSIDRSHHARVEGGERMGTDSVLHPFVTDDSLFSTKVNLVSPEDLVRLPIVKVGEDGCSPGKAGVDDQNHESKVSCPICLLDFEKEEEVRMLPNCGHLYHFECIKPWLLKQKNSCPMCQECVI